MHPVQVFELIFIMLLAILVLIGLRGSEPVSAVALLIGGGVRKNGRQDKTLHALERDPDIE